MLYQFILVGFMLLFFQFAIAKAKDPSHPSRRDHPCKAMFMNMKA